jgi:UPF0755 protein
MNKIILIILFLCLFIGAWFTISEIYTAESQDVDQLIFSVEKDDVADILAYRLEEENVIRNASLFKMYLRLKNIDKSLHVGTYVVDRPITLSRVAKVLLHSPSQEEMEITILPGWTIRDIAMYFEEHEISTSDEFKKITGDSAVNYKLAGGAPSELELDLKILEDKPWYVSLDGYLAPETYRIFKDASVEDIIIKLLKHREKQITEEMWQDIKNSGRSFYEVLTLASIVEKEVRTPESRAMVADLFWRRYDEGWGLQADSTVHYLVNKKGDVFTTKEDRDSNSAWNTYKYRGLPLGPISNPSLDSIKAVIYPKSNNYNYFLTTFEGDVKYAKDLDGHNYNVNKYLR